MKNIDNNTQPSLKLTTNSVSWEVSENLNRVKSYYDRGNEQITNWRLPYSYRTVIHSIRGCGGYQSTVICLVSLKQKNSNQILSIFQRDKERTHIPWIRWSMQTMKQSFITWQDEGLPSCTKICSCMPVILFQIRTLPSCAPHTTDCPLFVNATFKG